MISSTLSELATVTSGPDARDLRSSTDAIAEVIARPAGHAWTNWTERDLAEAAEMQRRMLPPPEQHWRGVDILAEYRPAHQVGGDFFDVVTRSRHRLTAVIGDVAGKGVTAGLIMARVSGEIRRVTRMGLRPGRILAAVNRSLEEQELGDRFVTAGCVALDLARAVWTVASAGHPPALLIRRTGALEILGQEGGPGLGLHCVQSWRCQEQEVPALAGDTLLLMTDGLTDRLDPAEVCAAALRSTGAETASPRAALQELRRDLFDRVAAIPGPRDDATLVALHIGNALPPRC
jgi:serine phosphatase RsbU (regulator of sigma subunit)